MAEVKWIKITTNIFDDEKIKLIDTMPDRDTLLVIWFKLLAIAGKTNDNGLVYVIKEMPTTDEMLATIFNRPLNTVRLALKTFSTFGMIEINNHVNIVNWEKHQNVDGLDKIREQNRKRQEKLREKKKALALEDKSNVTSRDSNAIEIDKEIDIELDKDKDNKIDDINQSNLEKDRVIFRNNLIKFIDVVVKSTELDKFRVEQLITPSLFKDFDLSELLKKISESRFLQGLESKKPKIGNFTTKKMLNMIMADGYKDRVKETETEVFKPTEYSDDGNEELFRKWGL
ncbi:phage replisome organizer N-terminal domain-containing protein [Cetobacterium sp.]|uniref:phage replisome organizer N-terminal domain-containing protein n=1 Tax=Cetobacterium sp. TaxID=2071632 RepID=UPI003F2AA139